MLPFHSFNKYIQWKPYTSVAYSPCFCPSQGRCASCYAFSVTGAIEGMKALASGKLYTLSEQNIIDCSGSATSWFCVHWNYYVYNITN